MAQSKPVKQQFADDDLIQCGICHVDIENPRSLSCLHTYCLACLREWSKKSGRKDEVACPLCREVTPLPSNGVDGLRSNFLITKLKERKAVLRQLVDKDVKIVCTACDVSGCNEAVARCLECDDFLCRKCAKAHKIVRFTKNHSVLTLVELRSGKVSLVKNDKEEHCTEHSSQVLWFYCNTCELPICRDCSVVEHPSGSHELVKLDVAMEGHREEIQGLVESCQSVKMNIDQTFQELHQKREYLRWRCKAINADIDEKKAKTEKAILEMLQQEAVHLKQSLAGMESAKEKIAAAQEDELQLLNLRLNTALEIGKQITTDGSNSDIATTYKPLIASLKQLEQVQMPTAVDLGDLAFVKAPHAPVIANSIGSVKEKKTWSTYLRSEETWNAPWKMLKQFGKMANARTVSTNQSENFAVADYDAAKVFIYSINDGSLTKIIDTSSIAGSKPHGLVAYGRNIIVADNTKFPRVYTIRGKYVRGITSQDVSNKLVSSVAGDGRDRVLVERGSQLEIYTRYSLTGRVKLPFRPLYMTVSSDNDKIVISAGSSEGARVIDFDGTTLYDLKPPTEAVSSWSPTGVCTFGKGAAEEIFISNCCNDRGDKSAGGVYRFSLHSGKYLGCVTTDVSNPQGIAFSYDEELVLIVADGTCVKVFAPPIEKCLAQQ